MVQTGSNRSNQTGWRVGSQTGRAVAAVGVALVLSIGLGAVDAVPAGANANGCTAYPGAWSSLLCNQTNGSGTYVSNSQVYRSDYKRTALFCEYAAKLWYTKSTGTVVTRYSSFTSGCTYPPRAWKNFSVDGYLRSGTGICGAWREDGRSTYPGSHACNQIRS